MGDIIFIEGVVGICGCGLEVHVDDVRIIAVVDGSVEYTSKDHCVVVVSPQTHLLASRYLRAKANHTFRDPSDEELILLEFEQALEDVRTPSDLERSWAT